MKNSSRTGTIYKVLALAVFVFVVAGGMFAIKKWENNRERDNGPEVVTLEEEKKMIRYNGQWYELRRDIETVLVIGLDKFSSQVERNSYNNDQRADFILLLMIDKTNNNIQAVHINRDTMADIQVLGVAGQVISSQKAQLALSYNYGSGGHDSCRNTVKAVSDYLYELPIDNYVSITMDAVAELNDMVDGVTVKLMDDFTSVDPEMQEGAEYTLTGDKALAYVRARSTLEDKTNMHRMERQRQYIRALFEKVKKKAKSDEDFALEVTVKLSQYMVTNLSTSSFRQLADELLDYSLAAVKPIEGEAIVGEEFMEFYPDEDALKEMLVNMFYVPSDYKETEAESPV